jgi:hypothetical protein
MTAAAPQDHHAPEMKRRSFYMRSDDMARLTALIEDLYFGTRRKRHEILAVMVDVIEQHRPEIARRLRQGSSRGGPGRKGGASRAS